jgi:hypothetical protein
LIRSSLPDFICDSDKTSSDITAFIIFVFKDPGPYHKVCFIITPAKMIPRVAQEVLCLKAGR